MRKIVVWAALLGVWSAQADVWRGLGEGNHYSGPKVTEEDLLGKVVLVDCWGVNCPPCRALLPRMEQIWQSFKSKPFVLLGSHCQGRATERVAELVKANKLTYPMYERAGVAVGEPSFSAIPFLYVVNHRGKIVFSGRDERAATEAVVTALGAASGNYCLTGDVELKKYKALEKQLVLGKSIKSILKKLEADVRKSASKTANAAQREAGEEAEAILQAVASVKDEIKQDIEISKAKDPVAAVKLIKNFMASFPEDGATYKEELADLSAKARALAAEKKTTGQSKKAK